MAVRRAAVAWTSAYASMPRRTRCSNSVATVAAPKAPSCIAIRTFCPTYHSCPCLRCAVKIVQTGVKEVVYQLEYSMDGRSAQIFAEAGVAFRQYLPPF